MSSRALPATILVLSLAAWSRPGRAEPPHETRQGLLCRAQSGVGFSYWYAKSCWCGSGCTPDLVSCEPGDCDGSCPDACQHFGPFGADCSGFVNKVWQVPGPASLSGTCSHGPYVSGSYTQDATWWNVIPRAEAQPADAMARDGHVALYESGDPWGSMWLYEAAGCSKGIVHNLRSLSADYGAARRKNLIAGCDSWCEGSILHDGNCQAGDCAPFGSTCVDDALGARCVFAFCPAVGTKTICLDDAKIAQCVNGAVQVTGDCSAFGCWCSTAGGTEPHCVMSLCVDGPDTIPWAHDICWQGERYHCDSAGSLAPKPCPGGQACTTTPTVHCEGPASGPCPPSGEADVCLDQGTIAHCSGGQVVSSGSCAAFGSYCVDDALGTRCVFSLCPPVGTKTICLDDAKIAECVNGAVQVTGDCSAFGCWCSTAGGTEPHCVMSLCVDGPDTIPWAHDICWQGERYHCDAQGGIVAAHCPGNQTCVPTPQPHCAGEGTPGSCPPSGQADICLDEGTIAHCSGGQVVSSGSCAMYGAYCVDDALETRCVFSLCPPVGKTKICLDDHLIADCDDGALGASGDCSAFGCWCSTAGNTEAHCVLALCVDSPDQIPVPHDICFDGKRYHCDGSGTAQELPLAAELCNAADDDCDGSADEGFGIGTACSTTAGSCTAWGELVCTLDGTGTVCSAPAPEGSPETCNGADDDCDGVADEGFSLGTPCVLGSGGCAAAGVMACAADGTGIVCDAEPLPLATETCNGLDDDCDGEPDNGFDVGVPCSEGEGLCLTGGTIQCQADGTAACSATPISCDDGDPCTSDTCDPSMGCRNEPLPGCCTTDAQCGAGKHCQDGQCVCGALGPATCQGDQLVAVDECGTMVVLETCAEGCAAAACCPPGTHADEDDCLPTVVGEDTAGGADTADADTTVAGEIGSGEGRAEADSDGSGFRIEAGPGSTPPAAGGGCTSGAPMPSAWLVSLASLLLLLGGSLSARIFSRGFRRPPGRA